MTSAARRRLGLRIVVGFVLEHAILRLLAVATPITVLDGADAEVNRAARKQGKEKYEKYTLG